MKDQFANYVVQKVLETCSDQQRELLMSRIKVHLNALKKYTYGKHIVARVEKLVAAGGMLNLNFLIPISATTRANQWFLFVEWQRGELRLRPQIQQHRRVVGKKEIVQLTEASLRYTSLSHLSFLSGAYYI